MIDFENLAASIYNNPSIEKLLQDEKVKYKTKDMNTRKKTKMKNLRKIN